MRGGGPRGAAFDAVRARFPGDAAVIAAVTRGSPAEAAGLRAGDVILAVGGRRIEVADEVLSEIGSRRPGSDLALEVWRAGESADASVEGSRVPVTVRLGTLDPSVNAPMLVALLSRAGLSGLTDASRGGRRGVEVGRADGPIAADIPSGSMIVAVDGLRVASLDDLWVRLGRGASGRVRILAGPGAVLSVVRPDGTVRDVDLPLR
ncbi:MAG: PDZ domain-containing protein [Phycisphaerales bacterium]